MNNTILIISFFSLMNIFLIIYFSKIKFFHLNIDKPDNLRKIHKIPVSLAGGTLIILNLTIFWLLINFDIKLLNNEIFFNDKKSLNIFMLISYSIFFFRFF